VQRFEVSQLHQSFKRFCECSSIMQKGILFLPFAHHASIAVNPSALGVFVVTVVEEKQRN